MKKFKKIVSILLTAIMVLAMCVPVMATESSPSSTYKITAPATNHVYQIYQIFTGDLSSDGKLSNLKWGENGTGTKGATVDTNIIDALMAVNSKSDKEILEVVESYANLKTPIKTVTNSASYDAVPGYYLIKDDETVTIADAYTTYIVKVVSNINITPKSAVPSFEKKIKDINDTESTEYTIWQDSADYDIGDEIPFKLQGTVASNYADYKGKYYFAFHDVAETGLTFNADTVKAYLGETEIAADYYTIETNPLDGCTFEVIFNNLKDIAGVQAGSVIRIEYTATLNNDAVLGNKGNVNKAKLEYSNNPNQEQEGTDKPSTGETPWDGVIAFTYKVVVNKYANSVSDGNKLAGAEFTLEKVLPDNTTKPISVVKSEDGTSFEFKGLDDGEYILTETKTPAGYNTITPIKFKVQADHTVSWEYNESTRFDVLKELTGTKVTGEITLTSNTDKSQLSTDIINKSGSVLPSTGGMGTTIFYVVGVTLMLGAGVLLVTKRRMNANH